MSEIFQPWNVVKRVTVYLTSGSFFSPNLVYELTAIFHICVLKEIIDFLFPPLTKDKYSRPLFHVKN